MAKSAEEKREYARKYYQEYTKKGKKKGRKKGKKKAKTSTLLGVSSAGLSPEGMIEAAAIKETLKKEMNAALAKAKTPEEQLAIRKEYSKKAMEQIQALKKDPKYAKISTAKPKATKQKTSSGSKKSSGGSSSKSSKESKTTQSSTQKASTSSTQKSGSTQTTQNESKKENKATQTPTPEVTQQTQPAVTEPTSEEINGDDQTTQSQTATRNEQIQAINNHIQEISQTLASLTPDQKEVVKGRLNEIIDGLKAKLKERLESLAG